MTANEGVQTDFEQKISSVKKTAIHLTIKCCIDEFESRMSSYDAGIDSLWSGDVSSELAPRAVWKLKVYPKSRRINNASVYLHLTGPMKDDREILEASYHLYLIDGADGTTDSIHRGTHQFGGEGYYSRPGINDEAVVSYDRVQKALQADGSLMVAADVEFLAPNDDGSSSGKAIDECALHADEVHKRWAAKFSEFYGDDASYDCTIQIGGESIPTHKLPLMANSPVFRVMFTSPVAEECKSGVVKITDFKDAEPMRAVIKFCYQGRLDAETMDGEGAVESFKLADRYCIADLKALFEKHFIAKTLSVENVVAMAVIADTYSAKELREACLKLLAREGKTVFESADWKELKKAKPELTTDLAVAAYSKVMMG